MNNMFFFLQLTTLQLLPLQIPKIMLKHHNMATSTFKMAQRKSIPYLLLPKHVAPESASLLGDKHSSLKHLISSKKVAFEPG